MRYFRRRKSYSTLVFHVAGTFIITLIAFACLFPFILLISGSFSSEHAIRFYGYSILPREFTTEAYGMVFKNPVRIVKAYGVSVFITAAGTLAGLFLITMTAYVISRKSFRYRNMFSFFFYSAALFYTSRRGGKITLEADNGEILFCTIESTYDAADPVEWRQWHHWNRQHLGEMSLSAGIHILTLKTTEEGDMNYAYLEFKLKESP